MFGSATTDTMMFGSDTTDIMTQLGGHLISSRGCSPLPVIGRRPERVARLGLKGRSSGNDPYLPTAPVITAAGAGPDRVNPLSGGHPLIGTRARHVFRQLTATAVVVPAVRTLVTAPCPTQPAAVSTAPASDPITANWVRGQGRRDWLRPVEGGVERLRARRAARYVGPNDVSLRSRLCGIDCGCI